jgi:hypothetical protein
MPNFSFVVCVSIGGRDYNPKIEEKKYNCVKEARESIEVTFLKKSLEMCI